MNRFYRVLDFLPVRQLSCGLLSRSRIDCIMITTAKSTSLLHYTLVVISAAITVADRL
jgi:hypothetical protein